MNTTTAPAAAQGGTKPADWDKLFPKKRDLPADGVFELGLVLGGTVSSGAYTAGVLDFLIEALDTWQAAKAAQPHDASVPSWDARIQVVTGTSGGGVLAALMGRALSWRFPHVRHDSTDDVCRRNPLYEVWVNRLDIMGMLDTSDLGDDQPNVASLLNPKPLEQGRDLIVNYEQHFDVTHPMQRPYLANPLPLFLTLTNLRGVRYRLDLGGGLSQFYVAHADHVRIAAYTFGAPGQLRPDEFGACLNAEQQPGYLTWSEYAKFALGTSAFPVGFPARELQRPVLHYHYRPVVMPGADGEETQVCPMVPDWLGTPPNPYEFVAADGGMTNNEPIQLARSELAGHVGRNSRKGLESKRGVLLIDPFADVPTLGPDRAQKLLPELGAMLGAWKEQARYDSRDILLANDENCFSRFMITACRPRGSSHAGVGGKAIATACAEAFGGFLSAAFRKHDFLLGRKNAQDYLRNKLVLPIKNPLFKTWLLQTGDAHLPKWQLLDGTNPSLPIIPLLGACALDEPLPPYPSDAFDVTDESFQWALRARIKAVGNKAAQQIQSDDLRGKLIEGTVKAALSIGDDFLAEIITNWFAQSLSDWELRH